MIPMIKSDRAGQPGVEPRGDGLYGACALECVIASPLRHVDHVYCFDLRWKFLLSPHIWLVRFILVFALRSLPFVLGVELASLLEDQHSLLV